MPGQPVCPMEGPRAVGDPCDDVCRRLRAARLLTQDHPTVQVGAPRRVLTTETDAGRLMFGDLDRRRGSLQDGVVVEIDDALRLRERDGAVDVEREQICAESMAESGQQRVQRRALAQLQRGDGGHGSSLRWAIVS